MGIRKKNPGNNPEIITKDGKECVVFATGGKIAHKVTVDLRAWTEYLQKDHWVGDGDKESTIVIKRNNGGVKEDIWRVIADNQWPQWRHFGRSIDHINRDRRDNRLDNLRPVIPRQNGQNRVSEYIYRNGNGYKVDTNVDGEKVYQQFATYEEAKQFVDTEIPRIKEEAYRKLEKKTRDAEFERGLREKLDSNERGEVLAKLRELGVI